MRPVRLLAAATLVGCTATCAATPARTPLASVTPRGEGTEEEAAPKGRAPAAAGTAAPAHPTAHAKEPCAADLGHCPVDGCEAAGTPHALFNQRKRRTTDGNGNAVTWSASVVATFPLLRDLQAAADKVVDQGSQLTAAEREKLRSLKVGSRVIGEGTAVRIVGYIAPPSSSPSSSAHKGGQESVNCRLEKPDASLDIHIPIVDEPSKTECEGVVVEMIPQGRDAHPRWTWQELRELAKDVRKVMAVGPLFYDNEHFVNGDCAHLRTGQPKRMSLWEVHPIAELYVCDNEPCTVQSLSGWKAWN